MAKIVLNTFGSLGDLHPYLAIAIELKERRHTPLIATSEVYRDKVQAEGIEFAPVRPDVGPLLNRPELIRKLWHPRKGSEYLLRDFLIPQVEQGFEDLMTACAGADLVLTHGVGYAGPIAAEKLGVRWISVALQPLAFFSAYDPPVIPGAAPLRHLYRFGPGTFRMFVKVGERRLINWAKPIADLRRRLGLPDSKWNPILRDQFSEFGTIACFSRHFAGPQPDWPPNVRVTGFIFYDQVGNLPGAPVQNESALTALQAFVQRSEPPVLFTLGSSAVLSPGSFFRESLGAVRKLGVRAVLLAGPEAQAGLAGSIPDSVFFASYVPYSEIMPKCAAIVHQGGIGTTAQALRAGKPMVVVPWSHDQPDNAVRLRRLGVARVTWRERYRAGRVARELAALLNNNGYRERCRRAISRLSSVELPFLPH